MSEEPVEVPFPGDTEYVAPPPGPSYIMTLEELVASQEALQSKESADRLLVTRFVNPDSNTVRTRLLQWAAVGFPNIFVLSSISLTPPAVCLDGMARTGFQYIEYLTGISLSEHVRALEQKLPGMSLSYSTPANMVCIHVTKG
jgi:hypothetical protein